MNIHPITLATIRRHLAEAELKLAVLESARECLPPTAASANQGARLARKIREAKKEHASWVSVEREASA